MEQKPTDIKKEAISLLNASIKSLKEDVARMVIGENLSQDEAERELDKLVFTLERELKILALLSQ